MLADFCERSFLKLWSYPNPYKDDGHELCDLLAVFGDYVFIFFDREGALPEVPDRDPRVLWDRWKRNVIDRQVKTAHGAERYIRSLRPIFLDSKGTTPFPIAIDPQKAVIRKILVAHGAKEASEKASNQNIMEASRSLMACPMAVRRNPSILRSISAIRSMSSTVITCRSFWRNYVTEFVPSTSAAASPVRTAKVGRNEPCPCGSGKKYKKCHGP
jgi:hypothetical protein